MTFLIWVHQCDCEVQSRVREVDTENLVEASIFANLGEPSRTFADLAARGGILAKVRRPLIFILDLGISSVVISGPWDRTSAKVGDRPFVDFAELGWGASIFWLLESD